MEHKITEHTLKLLLIGSLKHAFDHPKQLENIKLFEVEADGENTFRITYVDEVFIVSIDRLI